MAVSEQTPYSEHTGNGVTTGFSLGFICESKDHLIVLIDDIEPPIATWSLTGGNVVFTTAPAAGKKITLQRNTPFSRTTDYQSYNNSFRPPAVNKDFDWIWLKLQELGVADWILGNRISALKNYVDRKDDELRAYLMEEIRKQGVALDQLDEYYNYLMQRLAQIAVDKGWDASFVVDGDKTQKEINDSVKEKLGREFVSVWDFFTKSENQAYNYALLKVTPETFDSHRAIQAFLDHISLNYYGTVYFNGKFWISKGLTLKSSDSNRTTNIVGSPTIQATASIDTVFDLDYNQDLVWDGILKLRGTGDQVYSRRTCNHGLKIGGTSSRARFKGVVASNFKQTGIYAYAGSTLGDFGDVRVNNTGSGYTSQLTYNLSSTFSNPVNSGTSGSTSQYTTIAVATLPPEDLITECMVSIGGQPYYVQAIDRANNTLQIFPWLDLNNTETNLTYIFGAGVYMTSGDASVLRFSEIDATRCGVAVWHGSLYPPIIDALVTQYCGVGQILGIYPTRAMVGGQVNGYYCENNNIDLLKLTRSETIGFYISSQYAFNYAKVKYAGSPRDTNNALLSQYANLNGVTIADYNGLKSFEKYPRGFVASTLGINVTNMTSRYMIYSGNSKNINIGTPNLDVHNAFGYDSYTLVYVGTSGSAPTGTFTFNAPSGYTVNGQSSVSFSNFASAAVFHIVWQVSTNNFVVSCSGQAPVSLLASVTYDPGTLNANEIKYWNVTLTGAKLGDIVACSFGRALNGTHIWAEVTGNNIVTVYHHNPTASPVTLLSSNLTVKLI